MFLFPIIRKRVLTENFTCSSDKIVRFGVFIYDSNEELTLDIKLGLSPENKVKLLLLNHRKRHSSKYTVTVDNMFTKPIQCGFVFLELLFYCWSKS